MATNNARGRTARTVPSAVAPTKGRAPLEQRTGANRPVGAGAGKHRGDRRDTSRPFTNNNRRQPNHGDPLGSGKKQIQGGGKAVKGGGKREKGTYDH
jgi:hypothetical protein